MSVTVSYGWLGATTSPFGGNPTSPSEPLCGTPPVQAVGAPAPRLPRLQIVGILIAFLALAAAVSNILLAQQARLEQEQRAASLAQAAYKADLRSTQLFCAQIGSNLRSHALLNPSAHASAMALDVKEIIGFCDNVRRQLQEIALRDRKRSVLRQPGPVAVAAGRPASTSAGATVAARATGAFNRVSTVEDIAESSGDQLTHVGDLVNIAAGPLNFRKHVDNPSSNELRKAMGRGVVGIGLLAFPTMAGYLGQATGDANPFRADFQ